MMQSKSAPCRKGDEIRDYEAVANLPEAGLACDALLRGSSPLYADRLHDFNNKNVGPAAPVITGEVVVNATGNHEGVPLSAGVIAAVCISGFVVLFMCLCLSEIMSSLSRLRTRHSTSIFNRQHVHDDHSRAAPEGHVEVSSSNPTEVAGSKHRLARWVIKGLPIIKYKKQKVLQPGLTMSTNSASSVEFRTGQDNSRNAGTVIAPAALNHEMESALPSEAMYIDATPADSNRLECVVCLSPFEEDEAVRVLPQCCHTFHAVCIDSWLLLHSTCPLCRMQISSLDVEHDEEPARASYVIELCNTTSSY